MSGATAVSGSGKTCVVLPADMIVRNRDAGLDGWGWQSCPVLPLKDANVFPVVGSVLLQLGDFGSQFLDLPILVIHVLLDAICECTPVSRFLGCCFNLSMSSISATFLPGLVHGGS